MNSALKEILVKVKFDERFESLFAKHSHRNLFRNVNKEEVLKIISQMGYSCEYVPKHKYFKIDKENNQISLNLSVDLGIVEFILNIEIQKEKTGGPFGYLSTFLTPSETIKKPRFASYQELSDILSEGLGLYEDIKFEALKGQGLEYHKKSSSQKTSRNQINQIQFISGKQLINTSSDEKEFYTKDFSIQINNEPLSFALNEFSDLSVLEKDLDVDLFKQILDYLNANKNILFGYDSMEGLSLKYIVVNNNLIIISVGEIQPFKYSLYLAGIWKLDTESS